MLSAISQAENAGGGKIYVSETSIACSGQIVLSKANSNVQIIGVQNADGTYPELDFSALCQAILVKRRQIQQLVSELQGQIIRFKT